MPGLDVEDFYETDSSDNEENHSKLLSSVSQLDSTQRVKPAQRKEIASEVSEYNLFQGVSRRKNLIDVEELAQVLRKKSDHGVINEKFKRVIKKSRTLPKPLEKPAEERLKRSVGFENVKNQLRRWDAIVTRNALNDHISFPLNDSSLHMQKSNEFLSQFKTATPLEEELAKVLKEEDIKETANEERSVDFPLTLEEMLEKRKEMAQLRAKLSYKQSKAQRQSRIKSKKYHRILKREKIRQKLKEFEMLQKIDPEGALKKLSELDKTRALERASLRHRNTGQWAKNQSVRARYDVETRRVLAEQLKVSRELTQKISQLDSSDDDKEEQEAEKPPEGLPILQSPPNMSTDNPWTLEVSKEVQDFTNGYRKFWNEKNKEAAQEKLNKAMVKVNCDDHGKDRTSKVCEAEEISKGNKEILKENKETPKEIKETLKDNNKITKEDKKIPVKTKGTPKENKKNLRENKDIPKVKKATQKGLKRNTHPGAKKLRVCSKKLKTFVSIHPVSGVWIVSPVSELPELKKKTKRKTDDIDSLFDELDDKLIKKAEKKARKIQNKLKKKDMQKKVKKKRDVVTKFDLTLKNPNVNQRPDIDVGLLENNVEDIAQTDCEPLQKNHEGESSNTAEPAIDPAKFIQIQPKRLKTYLPENVTGNEDALEDEKAQQKMMEEAFGDDDVMAEFNKMKEEEKSNKVEIQTSLPGWGEWGGIGIVPKFKKKRMLVLNLPPRKDKQKKDIIISENENPNLKNHLVKEVPYPFSSVDAFEASIRAPVGRDWMPETAHQKLIQKPVVTKLGTVIEPMSENEIIRLKKAFKSPYQGKKRDKV